MNLHDAEALTDDDSNCNTGPFGPRAFASAVAKLLFPNEDDDDFGDDWWPRLELVRQRFAEEERLRAALANSDAGMQTLRAQHQTACDERDAAKERVSRLLGAQRQDESLRHVLTDERDAAIAAKEAAERANAMNALEVGALRALTAERDRLSTELDRVSANATSWREQYDRLSAELAEAKEQSDHDREVLRFNTETMQSREDELRSELSAAVARAEKLDAENASLCEITGRLETEICQHRQERIGLAPSLAERLAKMRPVVEAARAYVVMQNDATWNALLNALRVLDTSPPAEPRKCNFFACHTPCVSGESFCKGHLAGGASPPAAPICAHCGKYLIDSGQPGLCRRCARAGIASPPAAEENSGQRHGRPVKDNPVPTPGACSEGAATPSNPARATRWQRCRAARRSGQRTRIADRCR